jgi:hypothetical protein
MSVFTSMVTAVREVPGDPGQQVTIRKLAPRHLAAARKASQLSALANLKEMGGPVFIKEVQAMRDAAPTAVADATTADPLLLFDAATVIECGVIAWSYPQVVGREAIEDLDDATAEWLAREILRLAKPALFEALDMEAAQKNASPAYTAH